MGNRNLQERVKDVLVVRTNTNNSRLEIPWSEEPGRLQSMESLRVGKD